METLMERPKSPNDESLFEEGGSFRTDQSWLLSPAGEILRDYYAGCRVGGHGFLSLFRSSAGGATFGELCGEWDVGGHGIAPTDGLELQIDILAKRGFPHHLLENIKAIPIVDTQRGIVKGLLTSPHKVMHIALDFSTESKLNFFLRMFERDPGAGGYSNVPTDGLGNQIEKLAEVGIPQRFLDMIKAIPNEAAKYFIIEDFMIYTPEVMSNAFDNYLTEFKLESVGRIFRSDHGVGVYDIAPTDDLARQIEKLAELGFPSRLVEMIKEIPDEAAQRYIVKDFQTSVRNVMRNAFDKHLELKLMKLLVSDFCTSVGNYTVRRNGLPDVRINMPKKDNVPADQLYVGEGSVPRDGSPDVRIDMPKEVIVSAEQKNPHLPGGSVADIVKKEGVAYLSSSSTNVPGPSWAKSAMEVAKIFGYASTAVGHGRLNDKLSQFFIKAGAIATAASVIATLAMPLPAVVAWTVGPLALFILAAAILFN